MKIILAGATGFIGTPLRKELLAAGHQLVVLTKGKPPISNDRESFVTWDGKNPGEWAGSFEGADAVINLAGENIAAKRWTPDQKHKILSSRVEATRAIVKAIEQSKKKPALLINASAVGYYGNVTHGEVAEDHGRGEGFLAEVCVRWEEEACRAERSGVRVTLARLAPVLEKNGGVLSRMLIPFRFFLGGPPGSGRQWFPWIHREDVIAAFLFSLRHPSLSGAVNFAAPDAVMMEKFCAALGKEIRRPSWFPVPVFLLRLVMGEMADMTLSGQRAVPQKLLHAGYTFRYPDLEKALHAILK